MNLVRLNKKLNILYGGKVKAREEDGKRILEGELSDWSAIVAACTLASERYSTTHVVNDIVLTGTEIPPARLPRVTDKTLEGRKPDVLIIGGGVSGASIARELTRWKIDVLLVEKESDLACHASGRNDGEVHPGIDLGKGSLKQRYVIRGNAMYDRVCQELDVPFKRNGQYVGFTKGFLKPLVYLYALHRKSIGVKDTVILSKKELFTRLREWTWKTGKFLPCIPTGERFIPKSWSMRRAVLPKKWRLWRKTDFIPYIRGEGPIPFWTKRRVFWSRA